MNIRSALRTALTAARANLLPGVLLQCLMLIFLSAYIAHDGTRQFLAEVARIKNEAGYIFAFCSYIAAAALLPEIIRIVFFQSGKLTFENLWLFLTAAPAWGLMGVTTDFFYRCQNSWFGAGSEWINILPKVLVDQLIFSPLFLTPLITSWFTWRDMKFQRDAKDLIFRESYLWDKIFPVQVANWCVWIPAVTLIYFMPPLLQLPVAALIQCFWALLFTTLREGLARPNSRSKIS